LTKCIFINRERAESFDWSNIIGIWGIFREKGLSREIGTYRNFIVEDGQDMCKSRTTPRDGSSA
jgi:hypothetical protein